MALSEDERARARARSSSIRFSGTVLLLLEAHFQGRLEDLEDSLYNLRQHGLQLSDSLIGLVLKRAGEGG